MSDYYRPKPVGKTYKPVIYDRVDKLIQCAQWDKMRLMFLRHFPLCGGKADDAYATDVQGCGRAAGVVHHIIDRRLRPDLVYDWRNCQALCKACHDAETFRRLNNSKEGNAADK